jgi:hypothetical protein
MQKKRKSNKLLLGLAAMIAVMFLWIGCGGDSGGGEETKGPTTGPTLAPEKPVINASQTGFELIDTVDLATVTDVIANNTANQKAVISFTWTGEGALSYKVYQSDENVQPGTPIATLTSPVFFARNLEEETDYYFWVEAVNPNGSTLSDVFQKKTGKAGPQNGGGLERGDYPRNIRVVPGSGSLTVSWDLSDRVGWYEVYYAPKGTIQHLDIYTPVRFKYDSTKPDLTGGDAILLDFSSLANASDIAYKGTNNTTGYTTAVYPLLSPLASGWTGYEVRDGDDNIASDGRPQIGTNNTFLTGKFVAIGELYTSQPLRDPYKKLDAAFAQAIPWTGTAAGTAGTPVKFFGTSTTITGLADGTEYEVWIRPPNANGERGYGYIVGTPGTGGTLAAPANVTATAPTGEYGTLDVTWTGVTNAEKYRIYTSKYDYTPSATADYTEAENTATTARVTGLASNTPYYVWVVAEKDGLPGTFGTPVSATTIAAPASGHIGDKIIAGTTQKVKTAVYIEVNDHNPLNAGSYILEDGTYLFDYVTLFAANVRVRNCAQDVGAVHGCTESGPHIHLNENVRYILENRTKYIKPLQDKGIKVLLGLLGDHDGATFGTLDDTQRATFVTNLKAKIDLYELDGFDFDDEWGSKEDWDGWTNNYGTISPNSIWTYPVSSWRNPTTVTVYRNPEMGVVAGNGILTAPPEEVQNTMWKESGEGYYKTILAARTAMPDKIISLYEYNTGRWITPDGVTNETATKVGLEGALDFALQPWYSDYLENSANGLSRTIYSPFGIDVGGNAYYQGGSPMPPIVVNGNEQAATTISTYATRYKNAATESTPDPYGMLYFYALRPASDLLKYDTNAAKATVTKQEYISIMSEIVFGQQVILTADGGDYRKDW